MNEREKRARHVLSSVLESDRRDRAIGARGDARARCTSKKHAMRRMSVRGVQSRSLGGGRVLGVKSEFLG